MSAGNVKDVSEAAKAVGISRSTYYKYKDYVFPIGEGAGERKAVVSMTLSHKAGLLGEVLGCLSTQGANILTINQMFNLVLIRKSQAQMIMPLCWMLQ